MTKTRMITLILLILMLALPTFAWAASQSEGDPESSAGQRGALPPAEETDETSPPVQGEEPDLPVFLKIDNENIYEGMDKAYKDGYTPTIKNGKATVVLPLMAEGELLDNEITATPMLGDPASSPFVFQNHQKTLKLKNNPVKGGGEISSYLVRFDLDLSSDRFNGTYPITVEVQARDKSGVSLQQSFTCYVTIKDGKDPDPPEQEPEEPEEEPPVFQPKVLVESQMTEPSIIAAGKEFTLRATLKNTGGDSIRNMTVTAMTDSPSFALLSDSATIYIPKLGGGDTTDIEFSYKADLDTLPQRYNITLEITYDNTDAVTLSSSGIIPISVSQPLRVEMEAPQVPSDVNAGDTLPLSFQVMNLGRGTVYNVRCQLEAPGLLPVGTAFIGNMEPGTSMTGEMDVFVGMKNMTEGYEGDEKYGHTSGLITLIYEDETGQEYTDEIEIFTNINEPVIRDTNPEPEEETEKAGQWWISLIIGGVVILGMTAWLLIDRKRKAKESELVLP